MRSLLLFCALLGASAEAGTGPVKRRPASAELLFFCERPYDALCGKLEGAEAARAAKIEELRQGITERAWKAVLESYENAGTLEEWEALMAEVAAGKHKLVKIDREIAKVYFSEIYRASRELLGTSFESAERAFGRVRAFMLPKVRERLAREAPEEAGRMNQELSEEKIRFVNFLDLAEGRAGDRDFAKEMISGCGRDGMEDNAFATTNEKDGLNYVVICPGSFLAAHVPGRFDSVSENASFGLLWTLGHETGHHIDAREFPKSYEKLRACVASHHGARLKLGPAKIDEYMSEIAGDYWGTEALADYLATLDSPLHKLVVLRENLEDLCGSEDDGDEEEGGHPSGRFRIEQMVRQNPRLHEAMGCPARAPEKAGVSCTLRGAWRKRFW